jgi:hypothetical protein
LDLEDPAPTPAPEPRSPAPGQHDDLSFAMPAVPETDRRLAAIATSEDIAHSKASAGRGLGVYWLAAVASALWIGGMIGVALAYQQRLGLFEVEPFALGVFGAMAVAPLGFVLLGVYAVRHGSGMAAEMRRSHQYAERMLQPAAIAAAEAGSVVEAVRGQIERAVDAANQARDDLTELRDLLDQETHRLTQNAAIATQSARALVKGLGKERQELVLVTEALDGRTQAISEAIARQARMVAEASDLAQAQISEAEAALAARAADLTAAAGAAGAAARIAGEDLSRQAARLESAGTTIAEQVQVVEDVLGQQRTALMTAAQDLRVDQEDMAVQIEAERAKLAEILTQSGDSVSALNLIASQSAASLRQLTDDVSAQVQQVANAAQAERDQMAAVAVQSLGAFSEAAAFERRALEDQMRQSIDALQATAEEVHRNTQVTGEAARVKVEQLSEIAFSAGQKADSIFESRLVEARNLIERTAQLVDEAGERSTARLDASVGAARQSLEDLEKNLAAIEARAAQLPEEAKARAEEVRETLAQSTQDMLNTARQASEETQAIDSAFQDRVKRNYEMLSEAVRLMGIMGAGAAARAGARPAPAPPRPLRPAPTLPSAIAAVSPPPPPPPQPRAAPQQAAPPEPAPAPSAELDDEAAMFEPVEAAADSDVQANRPSAPAPAPRGDEWTWTDLLGAVDEGNQVDERSLAEILISEIESIGLEPTTLLPRSRIDEVLGYLDAGNPAGGRESVRRLAPAAIRRLSRQVLSDRDLRGQTDRFIQSYQSLLREASVAGVEISRADLLSSPAGRAYLLLDAAIGDLS